MNNKNLENETHQNSELNKVKQLLEEKRSKGGKIEKDLNDFKNKFKKSDARCEELVNQVETLTIAKTKALAETVQKTTLADSLQVVLDSKKENIGVDDENKQEKEVDKTEEDSKRKSLCKY